MVALLDGYSAAGAAKKSEVSERTVYRWLRQRDFAERLRRGREEAFSQATNRLTRAAVLAADVLVQIMQDKGSAAGVRVRAATAVLDVAITVRDISLTERIDQIEELLKTELETPIVQ